MGCASSAAVAPGPVVEKIPALAGSKTTSSVSSKSPAPSSHLDYKLGEKIGKGSYAQVHLATRKITTSSSNADVAVKIRYLHPESSLKSGDKDKVLKSSFNEVSVWKAVGSHVNCVELVDCFFDDHLAYMVMEKCAGSLFQYLRGHMAVTEDVVGTAFHQILTGLDHMHSLGLVHRDIKPDNFLVGGKKGNIAKICDFGLSATMPESGLLTGVCGTAPYMPPEMLATQSYNQKADVWSVGAVAYLLLCGTFPYQTPDGSARGMKASILKGAPADCKRSWLSGKATYFLQTLLKRNPEERPTAEVALNLPYFTKPDTESLPCLRQVLDKARKTGAFDSQNIVSKTEVDVTLEKLKQGLLGEIKSRSFTSENIEAVVARGSATKTKIGEDVGLGDSSKSSATISTACVSSPNSSHASSRCSSPRSEITARR